MQLSKAVPSILSILVLSQLHLTLARHQRHHRYRSQDEGRGRLYFRDPLKNTRSLPREENCPARNEHEVRSKGLSCVRKCIIDADCQNDRKLCLCDGLCGLSCIRPEKECPELPDPVNGQVHLNGRQFQDEARYSCNEGFMLVGVEKAYCSASGRWSGEAPSCAEFSDDNRSPYYCGRPPRILNANHNGSDAQSFWDLDTQLTYQCMAGYRRDGFDHAKCFYMNGTATWYGPDLSCKPIECGPPDQIQNGLTTGSCTAYRCQINYECLPGFKLNGRNTRICERDGIWSQTELPVCEAVQCSLPRNPENGNARFTALSYKSVVSYECNYGYMIVGNASRICGSDRSWSGLEPECHEINCGPPGGGSLPNGWLEGSRTSMHSVVMFNCLEGMTLVGHKRTTCGPDGKWNNPPPKCLAPCIIPQIEHGNSSTRVGDKVTHGDNITIDCEDRFETKSNSTPIQCNNGTWTLTPKCFPARCKTMPPPPKNGMIVVPQVTHGSIGLYQCKDGYRLQGKNTTFCNFGNWTADTPVCKEVYCPFPGYIANGKVLLVGNMGLYDYRPYVKRISNDRQIMFDCDKEYRLGEEGPKGATCVDGRWSPSILPTCLPDNHPNIRWLDKRSVKDSDVQEFLNSLKEAASKRTVQTKVKRIKRSLVEERLERRTLMLYRNKRSSTGTQTRTAARG